MCVTERKCVCLVDFHSSYVFILWNLNTPGWWKSLPVTDPTVTANVSENKMDIWHLWFANVFQPLCPCVRKHLLHACLCVTVSPLSSRTSWISTGFKAFEDQPATLVDPCPSFCLRLASPHALPYSELLCPFETSCPCWSDVVYWLPLLLPQHADAHMVHCSEHQGWLGCTHQQDLVGM